MIKKIGIISLSSGVLGEDFVRHEVDLGKKRLEHYGIEIVFLPHSMKGTDFIKNHPEARAEDLLRAFQDDSIDMILCAIGGEDTYRLLPFLFRDKELEKVAKQKIFLGFSDTTINHFMLHKVGIKTFYGQAFLPDICELSEEMLPYSKSYFEELITTGKISEIRPSDMWYKERNDFSKDALGHSMESFPNQGFELLRGKPRFEGEILGGCIESIYDLFNNSRFDDTVSMSRKYHLFPEPEEWKNKILLLETSEEKSDPTLYRKMIRVLKDYGLFDLVSGVLIGKPQDEVYYEEYKKILLDEIDNNNLPILYNLNIGHATPRCIIPFGVHAEVDAEKQVIQFKY